ncbi:MFS transporter [Pseudogemmobacter sp. W21_MBD1_M6]|uniref:MFS transporter n=1 Tax=Pseudogemmobacter sp. W21_MBD1_M6 TaxID=3240271 RepID=UPI003F991054
MLFATIAFSIDAMLPALPQIGQELTPQDVNRAQLIVTSFVFGMGFGTLFAGPISDALGRKRVILGGAALYILGAALASMAQSLELLLLARLLQGLGAAGPRVAALAVVRDLYEGRDMARIMSFVMMVFTLVPAIAPSLGALIIAGFGWRSIFAAFILFATLSGLWLAVRQPETLPPKDRRPMAFATLWAAAKEVMTNRLVVLTTLVQTLCYGALFAVISSTQQIFDITFDKADSFPVWFAVIAILAGSASLVNARVVVRLGMRYMVKVALLGQIVIASLMVMAETSGLLTGDAFFAAYVFWTVSVFFMTGLTLGNLNALAMEPMGHIAGMTASIVGAVSTMLAVGIAAPVGMAFDGTPLPIVTGVLICAVVGWIIMIITGERQT